MRQVLQFIQSFNPRIDTPIAAVTQESCPSCNSAAFVRGDAWLSVPS
jgi:hypothetical protein